MIPAEVEISGHAWERFIERMAAVSDEFPACPMMVLQTIIESSTREDLGAGAVIRMFKNKLRPAVYFRYGQLRLVLDESERRLITIEIAALARPKRMDRRRKKR